MNRFLLFTLAASVAVLASADPQGRIVTIGEETPAPTGHHKEFEQEVFNDEMTAKVVDAQRLDSVQVAEDALAQRLEDLNSGCLLRTVCAVGTVVDDDIPSFSMAHGLMNFRTMLEKMIDHADSFGSNEDHYPSIRKVLASFDVGASTTRLSMCEELFECTSASASGLLQDALTPREPTAATPAHQDNLDGATHVQARVSCEATAVICPGLSTGCALCGLFLPGTCGSQCIISGLYCGLSGYACLAQAAEAAAAAAKEETHKRGNTFRRRYQQRRQHHQRKPQYTAHDYYRGVFGRFH